MIHHQSIFERWPLANESVQAIITSPPYWGLRKYDIPDIVIGGDSACVHQWEDIITPAKGGRNTPENPSKIGNNRAVQDDASLSPRFGSKSNHCLLCGAWRGQYGLEPSYKDYVAHTILWAKEAWRVLRDDGVFFLNLGDSYNGGKTGRTDNSRLGGLPEEGTQRKPCKDLPPKCLMDIPARVSIALIDEMGWTKRNNIIWFKPNGMPESCKDRFTKKHESIFIFVKSPKYYFDLGAISTPSKTYEYDKICSAFERGRNKGYDLKIDSMQMEGRPKIVKNRTVYQGKSEKTSTFLASRPMCNPGDVWSIPTQPSPIAHYAMWPKKLVERMVKCSTRKGDVVLDPFAGSGTTLLVAEELGRQGVGIDLGYEKIQMQRLSKVQKEIF